MRTKLVKLIKQLQSPNEQKRLHAISTLQTLTPSTIQPELLIYCITSSAHVVHDNEYRAKDGADAIMAFVAHYDVTAFTELLVEQFPHMSIWARSTTLSLLIRAQTQPNLRAFLSLLDTYIDQLPFAEFHLDLTGEERLCVATLFPALFAYLEHPAFSYTIHRYIWLCLQKGTLPKEELIPHANLLITQYQALLPMVQAYQTNLTFDTKWSPVYQELRNMTALYLELFGFLPLALVQEPLNEALRLKDLRLRYFATASLLRHQQPIPQVLLDELAADNETRLFLYHALREENLAHRFPTQYADQTALATAEMATWLNYPTALGHIPSVIECMEVITRYHEELGAVDYYVFRFKSVHEDWVEQGWMAGVAGFYVQKGAPASFSHGYTCSLFEPWEEKTATEHLEQVFQMVDQLHEQ